MAKVPSMQPDLQHGGHLNEKGEAQDAINRVAMLKLPVLTLDGLGLTAIPRELAELVRMGCFPHIERLFLQHNKLETLSEDISVHSKLTELYLRCNLLSDLPNNLADLSCLAEVDLSNNKFTSFPVAITKVRSLQKLYMQSNQIQTIPPEIADLQQLQQLNLSQNLITELPPEFGCLKELNNLRIDTNKLTTVPREFGMLANLQFLSAIQNNIVHLPIEFGNLTKLETCLLHENSQLTILPTSIIRLTNLRKMTIDLPLIIAPQFISAGPKTIHFFVLFCQKLRLHINTKYHWIPDEALKGCIKCGTQFSFITRRHHCRLCGKLYCNKCCHRTKSYPALEPFLPARICEECYTGLNDPNTPDPVHQRTKFNYSGPSLLSGNVSKDVSSSSSSSSSSSLSSSPPSSSSTTTTTSVTATTTESSSSKPTERKNAKELRAIHSVNSIRTNKENLEQAFTAPPLLTAPPMNSSMTNLHNAGTSASVVLPAPPPKPTLSKMAASTSNIVLPAPKLGTVPPSVSLPKMPAPKAAALLPPPKPLPKPVPSKPKDPLPPIPTAATAVETTTEQQQPQQPYEHSNGHHAAETTESVAST